MPEKANGKNTMAELISELEAEAYVLKGERNGARRAAGRYKSQRDANVKRIAHCQSEIDMLTDIVKGFYDQYTGGQTMDYTLFRAAEDWLIEVGEIPPQDVKLPF